MKLSEYDEMFVASDSELPMMKNELQDEMMEQLEAEAKKSKPVKKHLRRQSSIDEATLDGMRRAAIVTELSQ